MGWLETVELGVSVKATDLSAKKDADGPATTVTWTHRLRCFCSPISEIVAAQAMLRNIPNKFSQAARRSDPFRDVNNIQKSDVKDLVYTVHSPKQSFVSPSKSNAFVRIEDDRTFLQ